MKSLPLLIFSILSLLGIVSYTSIEFPGVKNQRQIDPVSQFIRKPGNAAVQFNSTWNKKNEYRWVPIRGMRYMEVDIDKFPQYRHKYRLKSLPTIILYNNGKEVKRFEADIMMKLNIKPNEIQIR